MALVPRGLRWTPGGLGGFSGSDASQLDPKQRVALPSDEFGKLQLQGTVEFVACLGCLALFGDQSVF